MEGEGGESGGDGGREWCHCCRPLASCRCCPVIVPYRHRVVIMVPGVNELGCDKLGMGDAHRSSFGRYVTCTCFPGVHWPFLCACMSVRVRFGVVVAVMFIVGGVVALVASWSEACQWGSLVVIRLQGMVSEDSQE